VVLGVEEELDGVTDISSDVAGTVYQLTAGADLDRISRGGTGGGRTRTRGSVGILRIGSIHTTISRNSDSLSLCHGNNLC